MTDLREIEHESIRVFVQSAADEGYLSGRVLDYGCGKQPYRDIVVQHGHYLPWDNTGFPGSTATEDHGTDWHLDMPDAILCTQVLQYVSDVEDLLEEMWRVLGGMWSQPYKRGKKGHLVLTYPTNWPEVEPEDLHRFTKAGMERLLTEAGFEIVRHEQRAYVLAGTGSNDLNEFALGYGVICRA